MLATWFVLLIHAPLLLAASQGLTAGRSYDSRGTWAAFQRQGDRVHMTEREIHLQYGVASGRQREYALVVLFEPKSSLYSWRLYPADPDQGKPQWLPPPPPFACYVGQSEIIVFQANFKSLSAARFRSVAKDIDEATRRSLEQLKADLQPDGELKAWAGETKTELPAIDADFLSPGGMSVAPPDFFKLRITRIERAGKNFLVDIDDAWKIRVELDPELQLVHTSKIPR